ncbi:hypothetical protein PENSUB_6237 [Penicillium subrubescens]|uniref:Uncharacterized protein n=1 Tax=Penicillium subrubescens TaxID=1316194 RepID=A0A1Q5U1A8_9EURO|nr:hypothetical protein PENSUB_6237 [Penicillium subrubescens]
MKDLRDSRNFVRQERKYEKFAIPLRDLEHKLAHEYCSPLKHEIIRCGLTPGESSFMSMVLEDNPYCIWRDIGFMPFNGVSNPPFVDYILDQITTADHEGEAMEAFAYVDLLRGLQSSIPHVHDDEVCDMLSLFHRRYAEAFGTPYRREFVSQEVATLLPSKLHSNTSKSEFARGIISLRRKDGDSAAV